MICAYATIIYFNDEDPTDPLPKATNVATNFFLCNKMICLVLFKTTDSALILVMIENILLHYERGFNTKLAVHYPPYISIMSPKVASPRVEIDLSDARQISIKFGIVACGISVKIVLFRKDSLWERRITFVVRAQMCKATKHDLSFTGFIFFSLRHFIIACASWRD